MTDYNLIFAVVFGGSALILFVENRLERRKARKHAEASS
jgi:hypothetical protein